MSAAANVMQAGARRPAREQGPIDRAHLARFTLGNLPLEIEVLGLFAAQAPITLGEMAGAASDKAWHDAAHTLKGSARAVGAWRIAELAERAESLTRSADTSGRRRAVDQLEQALGEAVHYIDGLARRG